ncbi:transcriptional adapter 3 isoform X3 [Opisthocomus hoazin]|uniref:transcriptional adapter 3 isoform X3 n=1 Tax=Opisthocomus hoazin TaxID=30419 RepID=UPI003F5311B1
MSELKDCPLQFHDFKSVDHVKVCPRYTAVLARSEDDGIGIEELDTLQLELETLLSSASRRLRVLEAETQILTDWQDKKGDRRLLKLSKDHDVGASVKHGKPKKQKLEGKGGHGAGPGPGRPKSKNLQPKIQEYEFQDDPIDVPRIPKNDAPNRFWASVEPYCADLTNEEVRVLEELLKPPEDEAEHYKIPPLGKHYSQRWAQEDLLEEQKDGARAAAAADKKKGVLGPLTELDTKDVDALLKKSEAQHEQPEDGCPFGPLTQRLLQALVEENIISPVEDSPIPEITGKDSGADGAGTSPRSQNKPFSRSPRRQRPPHQVAGGTDQGGAGGPGAAGVGGPAGRGLGGRGAGRAAQEAGRAEGPQRPQPRQEARAAAAGQGGAAPAGAAAARPHGRQRGDGRLPQDHGRPAEEAHTHQEGEGPGLEDPEGAGEHPQAAGRVAGG